MNRGLHKKNKINWQETFSNYGRSGNSTHNKQSAHTRNIQLTKIKTGTDVCFCFAKGKLLAEASITPGI